MKEDIADLKKNPSSSVKYATSVSVPRGGFVFADGASFLARDKEEWLSSAMRELGLKHKSVAVGGENIRHTAYRLCKDTEYSFEELEKMDKAAMTYEDAATLGQLRALDRYESSIDSILQSGEPYLIQHLKVDGHDLMDLGYTGKDIKECLSSLLDTVIENPELNHKDNLLDIAQKNMAQMLCENEDIERS